MNIDDLAEAVCAAMNPQNTPLEIRERMQHRSYNYLGIAQAVIEGLELTQVWHIPTTRCKDGQSRRPLNGFDSLQDAEQFRDECLPEAQIYSQWVSPCIPVSSTGGRHEH